MDQNYVKEVLRKTDLVELAEEYLDEPMVKLAPNLWRARCPHPHHEDSTPSFDVTRHPDHIDTWCCHGCHSGKKNMNATGMAKNYGSDAIAFLQFMSDKDRSGHSISFMEALRQLAKRVGMSMPESDKKSYYRSLNLKNSMQSFEANLTEKERAYLYERGLSDEDIHLWHIGAFTFPKYGRRIVFPVITEDGFYRGYSARYLAYPDETHQPKYINSLNDKDGFFEKKKILYGENLLDLSYGKIYIVEGVMDVIIARKHGLNNVVATLGTALSEEHVRKIRHWNLEPTILYDGDSAGQDKTRKALQLFEGTGVYPHVCVLPDGKDPAEFFLVYQQDAGAYVERHSQSYLEYILGPIISEYHTKRSDLQRRFLPELIHLMKTIRKPEDLLLFKSRVKEELDIHL